MQDGNDENSYSNIRKKNYHSKLSSSNGSTYFFAVPFTLHVTFIFWPLWVPRRIQVIPTETPIMSLEQIHS